jgi:3'-phosphoadenosine 5'-phosphosulfate sulfotransferase (PAPS reductase)/FAD synthetase
MPDGKQIKISDKCCYVLKKSPARQYCKEHGLFQITGEMACDSQLRRSNYLKTGCNAFMAKNVKSTPIAFWTEKNVWEYIHKFNIPFSKAYLEDGCVRTGCIFCMFGITEEDVSRFAILKKYHPQLYDYCMNKLQLKDVFDLLEKQGIKLPYPYPQHL